eukprot:1955382-Heterocapsa_arctica.AAC.1
MLKNGYLILRESRITTVIGIPTVAGEQLAPQPRKLLYPKTCTPRPERNMARETYGPLEPEDTGNLPDS